MIDIAIPLFSRHYQQTEKIKPSWNTNQTFVGQIQIKIFLELFLVSLFKKMKKSSH